MEERSRLIRQALDIVQEVAFYKVLSAMGPKQGLQNALALQIQTRGDWLPLYHEVQSEQWALGSGAAARPGAEGFRPGDCVTKYVS